jgi:hypothetical protein
MGNTLEKLAKKSYVPVIGRDYSQVQGTAQGAPSERLDEDDSYRLYNLNTYGAVGMHGGSIPDDAIKYGRQRINGSLIVTGTVQASKLEIGSQTFITSIDFTTDSADKASWASGTITTLGGAVIAINSGDTGNLQKLTSPWSSDANTLALWHMDEDSGTALDNVEGDANWDGTATGTTVSSSSPGAAFDDCRSFDGVDDFVTIADTAEMDQTTFSWEGWFKTSGTVSANKYLVSRSVTGASSTARFCDIFITEDGLLEGIVYGHSAGTYYPYDVLSTTQVDDSAWHHFALTFDAATDTLALYIDGIRVGRRTDCVFNPNASAQPIYFGKSDLATPGFFAGSLDEIRFSNTARSYTAAATRFVYYDRSIGGTLQVTTTRSDSLSADKILLCIMEPQIAGSGAVLTLINREGTTIDGNRITTGRIQSADTKTYFDLDTEKRMVIADETGTPRAVFGKL